MCKYLVLKASKSGQISFGVFSANLSAPILVLWVLCPFINQYFYKKLSLYIQIPNIYVGLGFEFGLQRIRDLSIVYAYKAINNAHKDPFNNQTVKSKFSF